MVSNQCDGPVKLPNFKLLIFRVVNNERLPGGNFNILITEVALSMLTHDGEFHQPLKMLSSNFITASLI